MQLHFGLVMGFGCESRYRPTEQLHPKVEGCWAKARLYACCFLEQGGEQQPLKDATSNVNSSSK